MLAAAMVLLLEQSVTFRRSCAQDCDGFALLQWRVWESSGFTQMIRTVFLVTTPTLTLTVCVALGKLLTLSRSLTHHFSCIESPPSPSQIACCLGAGGCCSHTLSSSGSYSPVPQTCKGDLRLERAPSCRSLPQGDLRGL